MAEVFTISGAPAFGAFIPADLKKMDMAQQGKGASAGSPAMRMQNALKALGNAVGDPLLRVLKVDGVVGPATVKAVNYAIGKYAPTPHFPKADVTVEKARIYAPQLAWHFEEVVKNKYGGAIPPLQAETAKAIAKKVSIPSFAPAALPSASAPEFDKRIIWWVVGGVSILLVLSVAAGAVKQRRRMVPA